MTYNIFQHKHNFSVWAAARATQRGWEKAKLDCLKGALENCGVVDFIKAPSSLDVEQNEFVDNHRKWCRNVMVYLNENGVKKVSFGRSAKLVAVYLKSMIVVGGNHDSKLAEVMHPPIDRIILTNISKSGKTSFKGINWTDLDESEYYAMIDKISNELSDSEPMWMLEKFWII